MLEFKRIPEKDSFLDCRKYFKTYDVPILDDDEKHQSEACEKIKKRMNDDLTKMLCARIKNRDDKVFTEFCNKRDLTKEKGAPVYPKAQAYRMLYELIQDSFAYPVLTESLIEEFQYVVPHYIKELSKVPQMPNPPKLATF